MNSAAGQERIRTPDQRLRVFVSSTLQELAPERKAARRAIERLFAAPVMFELGARPHPPRSLYRAYLEQSDIFVGIYWNRYGWVAPGETVSGLEDEYNLAPRSMPKLIYVKETDTTREPGLLTLLARIRDDDTASYKAFRDARELAHLLASDLAVLLAERFDDSRSPETSRQGGREQSTVSAEPRAEPALPEPLTRLIGRDRDVERVGDTLRSPGVRLVTLTGPGGIGKTRLAIEAARHLSPDFPDGVTFVPLANVDSGSQVPTAIAQSLGVLDTGDSPLEEKLVTALGDRSMLLVLDNFEQVLSAAPLVSGLLQRAPKLKILVTSRALLRISGEQDFEVSALELPSARISPWEPGLPVAPSADLFVQRARAVKPDFQLTSENADTIERIVARLEGVPLAIELAAARIRLLTPGSLLERLDRKLAVLVGGQRDAPPRQQTVRNTIEWSTRLLGVHERELLWRLGVFAGPFSLEATEAVAAPDSDVLPLMETLVDASLVRQQDREGRTYFALLATVREHSLEQLEQQGLLDSVRERHSRYYTSWADGVAQELFGPEQVERLALLSDQIDNLRAAARQLVDSRDWDGVTEFTFSLTIYWWMGNLMGEASRWMKEVLAAGDALSARARAIALCLGFGFGFWHHDSEAVIEALSESAELFRGQEEPAGEAFALWLLAVAYGSASDVPKATSTMGRALRIWRAVHFQAAESLTLLALAQLELAVPDLPLATQHFEAALDIAQEIRDPYCLAFALNHLGWARLFARDVEEAVSLMSRGMDIAIDLKHDQAIAHSLEGLLGVAGVRGSFADAGRLGGAARALRERTGLYNPSEVVFEHDIVETIRASAGRETFDTAFEEGRRMGLDDAIALARNVAAAASAGSRDGAEETTAAPSAADEAAQLGASP